MAPAPIAGPRAMLLFSTVGIILGLTIQLHEYFQNQEEIKNLHFLSTDLPQQDQSSFQCQALLKTAKRALLLQLKYKGSQNFLKSFSLSHLPSCGVLRPK